MVLGKDIVGSGALEKILEVTEAHPGKHLNPPISIHCNRYTALLSTGFKSNALLEILISSQITMNINDEKLIALEFASGPRKSSGPTLGIYK